MGGGGEMALVGLHLGPFYAYQPISARESRAQHGSEDDFGVHHHQAIQPCPEMPLCCVVGLQLPRSAEKKQVDSVVGICQEISHE